MFHMNIRKFIEKKDKKGIIENKEMYSVSLMLGESIKTDIWNYRVKFVPMETTDIESRHRIFADFNCLQPIVVAVIQWIFFVRVFVINLQIFAACLLWWIPLALMLCFIFRSTTVRIENLHTIHSMTQFNVINLNKI